MDRIMKLIEFLFVFWGRRAQGRLLRQVFRLRLLPSSASGTLRLYKELGHVSHMPKGNRNVINETKLQGSVSVEGVLVNEASGLVEKIEKASQVVNLGGKIRQISLPTQHSDVDTTGGDIGDIATLGNVYVYEDGFLSGKVNCRQLFVWGKCLDTCELEVEDLIVIGGIVAGKGVFSGGLMLYAGGDIIGDLSWQRRDVRIAATINPQKRAELLVKTRMVIQGLVSSLTAVKAKLIPSSQSSAAAAVAAFNDQVERDQEGDASAPQDAFENPLDAADASLDSQSADEESAPSSKGKSDDGASEFTDQVHAEAGRKKK